MPIPAPPLLPLTFLPIAPSPPLPPVPLPLMVSFPEAVTMKPPVKISIPIAGDLFESSPTIVSLPAVPVKLGGTVNLGIIKIL
ncbi:MAG: hypothetical protein KME50_07690 [Nostoc desertorum CM1-VF14]|nr:hypothetical protein [Nostoc desertorum CM1-VF14]